MSARTFQSYLRNSVLLLSSFLVCRPADAQLFPRARPDNVVNPKNIHGVVQDLRGTLLPGARVFLRDMKTKVVRTIETDQNGEYKVFALPPNVDYELYADFKGKSSEKKFVSSFLNREDNVLNFQLDVAVIEGKADTALPDPGVTFKSFDLVELHASFEMPSGIPAPVPAVLLLHGYGEDRSAWKDFGQQLRNRGWAVMALDLRGHGESKSRNQWPIQTSPEWRKDPHEFPVDLDPALDWLKAQPRIDTRKIDVIGSDVRANLARIVSGWFSYMRSFVSVRPDMGTSQA